MRQLQNKNPQAAQRVNDFIKNGGTPESFLQQYMGSLKPEQIQNVMPNILQNAQKMGCPENVLAKVQNMMNKK